MTEFGQFGDQRPGDDRSHAGHGLEKRFTSAPDRAGLDALAQVGVDLVELPLQPADVLLDDLLQGRRREPLPVPLGDDHGQDLSTAGEQGVEQARLLVGQATLLGPHPLREQSEDSGVSRSGLASWPTARAKSRAWRG